MLFGWGRVGPRAHFFATLMVAIGTCISMFWILSSNSWMQTPQGFAIENGIIVPKDWFAIVFNPSFPYRFTCSSFLSFIIIGRRNICMAFSKGRRDELVKNRSRWVSGWCL